MSKMVMGWRVAIEFVFFVAMILVLVGALIWLDSRVFGYTKASTEARLEQIPSDGVLFCSTLVLIWLLAWQRVELHSNTGVLRLANFTTAYRWQTLSASKVTRIAYAPRYKALGRMTLHLAEGRPTVLILENSFFALRPSRQLKEIAAFVIAHNPDVEIDVTLKT